MHDFKIKIYADGADIEAMKAVYKEGYVKGFTTNPTLMKKAGVKSYEAFARQALKEIPDLPLSFEVFADDFETMRKEALKINSWGSNLMIKIPISNTKAESSVPLIRELSKEGLQLNVTAMLTYEQVESVVSALVPQTENYLSVFAGRIADTGVDPMPLMRRVAKLCTEAGYQSLWASCRELLNIFQAQECGCDIITVTSDILKKLPMIGLDHTALSLDTVKMFHADGQSLGYSIL